MHGILLSLGNTPVHECALALPTKAHFAVVLQVRCMLRVVNKHLNQCMAVID